MCKKRGIWPQAEGKYGVDWPTCTEKPTDSICEDVPSTPEGYMDDFTKLSYFRLGTTIAFKCAKEGFLAGNAEAIYYT